MTLNEYQTAALVTWTPPERAKILDISYLALGLGEAGEVQGKVKKMIRDDGGHVLEEKAQAIVYEMGDTLWYLAVLASELGYSLEEVAKMNVDKLRDRKERGVIKGSGDNR